MAGYAASILSVIVFVVFVPAGTGHAPHIVTFDGDTVLNSSGDASHPRWSVDLTAVVASLDGAVLAASADTSDIGVASFDLAIYCSAINDGTPVITSADSRGVAAGGHIGVRNGQILDGTRGVSKKAILGAVQFCGLHHIVNHLAIAVEVAFERTIRVFRLGSDWFPRICLAECGEIHIHQQLEIHGLPTGRNFHIGVVGVRVIKDFVCGIIIEDRAGIDQIPEVGQLRIVFDFDRMLL